MAEIRADESVEASSGDTHSDAGPTPLSSVDLDVVGELDGQAGEDVSEQAAQSEDDAVFEYAAQDADTKTADHAPPSAAGPALGDGASASEDASPLAPIADEAGDSPLDGSGAVAQHRTADQQVLREVDTYMAFECYQEAELLLDELMRTNPGNPEYHLRLLHIQSAAGDLGKAEEEEQILAAMMDGPLSETIGRVKEIGRGLMPGHHLFEDDAQIGEAKRIIAEESNRQPAQAGPAPEFRIGTGPGYPGISCSRTSPARGQVRSPRAPANWTSTRQPSTSSPTRKRTNSRAPTAESSPTFPTRPHHAAQDSPVCGPQIGGPPNASALTRKWSQTLTTYPSAMAQLHFRWAKKV